MNGLKTGFMLALFYFFLISLFATVGALWWEAKGRREPQAKLRWVAVLILTIPLGFWIWLIWSKPKGIRYLGMEIGEQHQRD